MSDQCMLGGTWLDTIYWTQKVKLYIQLLYNTLQPFVIMADGRQLALAKLRIHLFDNYVKNTFLASLAESLALMHWDVRQLAHDTRP